MTRTTDTTSDITTASQAWERLVGSQSTDEFVSESVRRYVSGLREQSGMEMEDIDDAEVARLADLLVAYIAEMV